MKTSIPVVNETLKLAKSFELAQQGKKLVAGFPQSMMKKPEQFALGHFPIYIDYAEGA